MACDSDLKGLHKIYKPVCKMVANIYTFAVDKFRGGAFKTAQDIARKKEMLDLLIGKDVFVDDVYYSEVIRALGV